MYFSFLLFALLHSAVPAICVASYGAGPVWLVSSIVFSTAVFATAQLSSAKATKVSLCLVSGLGMFLTLMLGVSYYMQGTGFNDQFFYHLDFNTLAVAVSAYGRAFFPAMFCLLLAIFAPLMFYRWPSPARANSLVAVLLWLGAVGVSYPVHSLLAYRLNGNDGVSLTMPQVPERSTAGAPNDQFREVVGNDEQVAAKTANAKPKNIIFIYAEGLERLYFDREVFGDLLPNLRDLSATAHQFTNVYQVGGTGWTIAGLVASQCGFPLVVSSHLAGNTSIASVDRPFEGESCFADVLKQKGYQTVFMGGASLDFGGKGNFLRAHGFDRVLGREELMPLLPDQEYKNGWGLQDDSLFELAVDELKALEKKGEPYLLTLLTLGTHHPDGFVAKTCEKLDELTDSMSQALFCTDQLIGRFIRHAMDEVDMEQTVIVLFSDHLAIRNTLADKLDEHKDRRRLTWLIFDDRPPISSDQVATHFDVGPTILETAGIKDYPPLGQGFSLANPLQQRVASSPPVVDSEHAPKALVSGASVRDSGFRISYENLTIRVGDLAIKANKKGGEFRRGLFMLLLDDDGYVTDSIWSDDFAQLISELEGRYVVGFSIHRPKREHQDQFFFGRLSQDLSNFRAYPLNSDVLVAAADLNF